MTPRSEDPRVARVIALFESFAPADVVRLAQYYAPDVHFKDPFNDVHGVPAVQRVFVHMFASLDEPRFVVHDAIVQGEDCFLTWDFRFRFKRFDRVPQTVRGSSHLRFDAQGRLRLHRDYWDAAEELYEKLPVVGALMRWLKRRANR
jgi:ketosteroid isomerase-like protein